MTHKTIDISKEIYKKLIELKLKDESISNFILRLIDEKKNLISNKELERVFEGDSEEWGRIEKILYEDRLKSTTFRYIELCKKIKLK